MVGEEAPIMSHDLAYADRNNDVEKTVVDQVSNAVQRKRKKLRKSAKMRLKFWQRSCKPFINLLILLSR